jgi:hypothetical protein
MIMMLLHLSAGRIASKIQPFAGRDGEGLSSGPRGKVRRGRAKGSCGPSLLTRPSARQARGVSLSLLSVGRRQSTADQQTLSTRESCSLSPHRAAAQLAKRRHCVTVNARITDGDGGQSCRRKWRGWLPRKHERLLLLSRVSSERIWTSQLRATSPRTHVLVAHDP